ncbi:hypothetical protein FOZ63_013416 [Perkinsus olseni]|uniref:Raptor N-terminal CASPase-like domain-containing protein n=1 Tax=Perkinsus olseni TaxID=32597 RepID=A0A7J6R9A3_PEROL|nr:hypothetical protein FOZ63_013416 [Perkinsus olseni]
MNCTVDWKDPPSNTASELPFISARSWADPAACLSENEIIRTTQAVMVVNTGSGWRADRKYLNTIEKIQLQQWSHAKQGVHKLFKEEGDRGRLPLLSSVLGSEPTANVIGGVLLLPDTTPIADSLKNLQMLYYRLFRFEPGSVWKQFENAPMPAQLCRVCPDPTPDHLRRVCHTARRSTTERIVFHYLSYHSGSGVTDSQPTGLHGRSLPMYNQALDECSPIGIHKLIGWLAKPTIYIFDCDFAGGPLGSYVDAFHEAGVFFLDDGRPSHHPSSSSNSTYILASCGRHEHNPHLGPTLPSQLLTACLTAPLKTSLQFLCSGFYGPSSTCLLGLDSEDIQAKLELLLSRLGETTVSEDGPNETRSSAVFRQLNSVFTSIMNSIAWSTLSAESYETLFRKDVVLASLFRNYLLAQRLLCKSSLSTQQGSQYARWDAQYDRSPILFGSMRVGPSTRTANCCRQLALSLVLALVGITSVSTPKLPDCSQHPLWETWELVLESSILHVIQGEPRHNSLLPSVTRVPGSRSPPVRDFFKDQLRAFSIWLRGRMHSRDHAGDHGSQDHGRTRELPILLQVLSHSVNRLCSLRLLAAYCDLGRSEIRLCLKAGLLPYLQKLLPKSSSTEASGLVLFLWAKVVALEVYEESAGLAVSKRTTSFLSNSEYKYILRLSSSETIDPEYRALGCLMVAILYHSVLEAKQSSYLDTRAVDKLYRCLISPHAGRLRWAALLALAALFSVSPEVTNNVGDSDVLGTTIEARLVTEFTRTNGLPEAIARSALSREEGIRSAALLLVTSLLSIFGDREYLSVSVTNPSADSDREHTIDDDKTDHIPAVAVGNDVKGSSKETAKASEGGAVSTSSRAGAASRRSRRRRTRARGGRRRRNGDLVHDLQSKASQCGMFFQNLSIAQYEQQERRQSLTAAARANPVRRTSTYSEDTPLDVLVKRDFVCKVEETAEDGSISRRSALCRQWLVDLLKESRENTSTTTADDDDALGSAMQPIIGRIITVLQGPGSTNSEMLPLDHPSVYTLAGAIAAATHDLIHLPQLNAHQWFRDWKDPFRAVPSLDSDYASSDAVRAAARSQQSSDGRPAVLTAWNYEQCLDDLSQPAEVVSEEQRYFSCAVNTPRHHGG